MSCCDDSTFTIVNNTGAAISITSIGTSSGTFRGFEQGSQIPDSYGSSLSGSAYSSGGSSGAASGNIGIKIAPSTTITLNYGFKPSNAFGHCPCTSSAGSSPITVGNFVATATVVSGQNDGTASVTWTVATQPA